MNKFLNIISKVTLWAAIYSVNSYCSFIFYEHPVPTEVLKYKKTDV